MAMFMGSMLGGSLPGLITPLLGMIPQAPGGPANPFAPTSGSSTAASSSGLGMLGGASGTATQLYDQFGQPIQSKIQGMSSKLSFLTNPGMLLAIGGAVLVVIILK